MDATDPPDGDMDDTPAPMGPARDGVGHIPWGGVEDHETLMECLRVFAEEYGLHIIENPKVVMRGNGITLTLEQPQVDILFGMNQMFVVRCERSNKLDSIMTSGNIVGIGALIECLIRFVNRARGYETGLQPAGGTPDEQDSTPNELLSVVQAWADKPEVDFRVLNEGPFIIATPIRRYRAWNAVRPRDERRTLIVITPHGGTGTKVAYRDQLFPFKDADELRLLLDDMTTRNPMTLVDIYGMHPEGLGCTAHLDTWPIKAIRQLHDRLVFLESAL